jgi:F-type H+-transporting ATPase subunit gamma
MANLKEVRNRIQSVISTQQITKAMKMVAAAKLRRAQDAITQMRPYAQRLNHVIGNVSASVGEDLSNPFAEVRPVNKVLVILVTSDRGLCGAFNTNINKAVLTLLQDKYPTQLAAGNLTLLPIGKKGSEFFARRGYKANSEFVFTYSNLSFATVSKAAQFAMDGFVKGDFDEVMLVFNEFKNVATQIVRSEQMLPLVASADTVANKSNTEYIFEPSAEYILETVLPASIKMHLYKAVLESNASEHGARMTAMDKATDNAGELLKDLRLTYNRSRQAAITKEILEIVGGAEALAAQ